MSDLIIWTYDWVPQGPRGFVRDLRLRWACEEAGLAYSVRTVAFDGRETNHLSRQPFGQVPFLSDGELEIFESGAGLLHLARKNERLMPRDPVGEAQTLQWMIAALNTLPFPGGSSKYPARRTTVLLAGWETASTSSRRF